VGKKWPQLDRIELSARAGNSLRPSPGVAGRCVHVARPYTEGVGHAIDDPLHRQFWISFPRIMQNVFYCRFAAIASK